MKIPSNLQRFLKSLTRFFLTVLFGLLLSIMNQVSSSAALLSTTSSNTPLINPAGGDKTNTASCAADQVVVGFRWSGGTSTSSPYSIFCRALNADGTIPETLS